LSFQTETARKNKLKKKLDVKCRLCHPDYAWGGWVFEKIYFTKTQTRILSLGFSNFSQSATSSFFQKNPKSKSQVEIWQNIFFRGPTLPWA